MPRIMSLSIVAFGLWASAAAASTATLNCSGTWWNTEEGGVLPASRIKGSPDQNDGHYVDYNDNYHIKERVDRTKGNKYALGFIVQTNQPGIYPLTVKAMTDDGEGKAANEFSVHVE